MSEQECPAAVNVVKLGYTNTAGGAGSTVIVPVVHLSKNSNVANVQVSVGGPLLGSMGTHYSGTEPLISQTPLSPLVYDKDVGAGAAIRSSK